MKARRTLHLVLAIGLLCVLLGTSYSLARAAEGHPSGGAGISALPSKVTVPENTKSAEPTGGLVWLLKVLLAVLSLGLGDLALCYLLIGVGRPGGRRSG